MREANRNYAAAQRMNRAQEILENAKNNAASTGSGFNGQNTIKQAFKPLMQNGFNKARGYGPEAQEALRDVVHGGSASNGVRYVGNVAGGGGGLGAGVTGLVGHALAGPMGWALPGVGHLAKHLGASLSERDVNTLIDALGKQAPVNQRIMAANTHAQAVTEAANKAALQQRINSGVARAMSAALVKRAP
jgi:hypothetical protein